MMGVVISDANVAIENNAKYVFKVDYLSGDGVNPETACKSCPVSMTAISSDTRVCFEKDVTG